MFAIQTETLATAGPAARALADAHWQEVEASLHGRQEGVLDVQRYADLEALHMLHLSTARQDGTLAGYAAFTLVPCPHRRGLLLAALDGLYLRPDVRRGPKPCACCAMPKRPCARKAWGLSSTVLRPRAPATSFTVAWARS